MLSKNVTVNNEYGLNATESIKLTNIASSFQSDVFISSNSRRVNAKSIMGVMMLAACNGTNIKIETNGIDSEEAMDAIVDFFNK
ncbi:phosphocarrier protein [Candidatus Kinetoplastibacterium blastocrithidii TCC012E]|uniref:Phosphocarrier protein n=1 Tax=Candidatus Kinetoplastidibacterium blastocrithidiae TCC012E TaxID=1208922 RepID=M1LVT0_9PROT|nr:HPr family phosphocarrier protein [Candidatus Kinetoplastibacterium blastocrithidii]AFZ83543.1 phosphocarrier protein [Candidatus Kinetoplastibacterium blastocrithidii (ex Strigomonas culicis)]AGF49662.1 phosphocarrier protein [Candidatus Kinetoplastibacterium blastocrithidii TCC012E]